MKFLLNNFYLLFLFVFSTSCSDNEKYKIVELKEVKVVSSQNEYTICQDKIDSLKFNDIKINHNHRKKMLAATKMSPIVFLKEPVYNDTDSKRVKTFRKKFEEANPWSFIVGNAYFFDRREDITREVFLRNGYIYTDRVFGAYALGQIIKAKYLFNSQSFWIQRGSALIRAEKRNGMYFFATGPYKGRAVTLNFADRVSLNKPTNPLHVDFRPSMLRLQYNKIEPLGYNNNYVLGDAYYNENKVKTLFKRNGAKISLDCETSDVSAFREKSKVRNKAINAIKSTMLDQVAERIPFDEPKTEIGQQDGELRNAWMNAFYGGRLSYVINHDRYRVYDHLGFPIPPQVCVDFIVDTLDRASGSWYSNVHERRRAYRKAGLFNSKSFVYKENGKKKHYALRNVDGFTHFIKNHPQLFELIDVDRRVFIGSKKFWGFLDNLNLKAGDMVFIKGKVPWDNKSHAHSFFIFENDPITGFPYLLAGNAGPASLRPWKIETYRTPNRYIFMIVRPKDELLNLFDKNVSLNKLIIK